MSPPQASGQPTSPGADSSVGSDTLPQSTASPSHPPPPPREPLAWQPAAAASASATDVDRHQQEQGQGQQQENLGLWARFKLAVKKLKREVLALHYAVQDPRVGILPRVLAFLAIAYALSPFDLIPDFIPVLGLIDDLIILPGLLLLAMWCIPAEVMAHARQRAQNEPLRLHKNWGMALFIFLLWDAALLCTAWWACNRYGNQSVHQYKVWILVSCGAALAAAELGWAVHQYRREKAVQAVLAGTGAHGDLQESLLAGGHQAVHAYLEP